MRLLMGFFVWMLATGLAAQDLETKKYDHLLRFGGVSIVHPQGSDVMGPSNMVPFGNGFLLYDHYQSRIVTVSRTGELSTWMSTKGVLPEGNDFFVELVLEAPYLIVNVNSGSLQVIDSRNKKWMSRPILFPAKAFLSFREASFVAMVDDLVVVEENDATRYHAFRLPMDPTKTRSI